MSDIRTLFSNPRKRLKVKADDESVTCTPATSTPERVQEVNPVGETFDDDLPEYAIDTNEENLHTEDDHSVLVSYILSLLYIVYWSRTIEPFNFRDNISCLYHACKTQTNVCILIIVLIFNQSITEMNLERISSAVVVVQLCVDFLAELKKLFGSNSATNRQIMACISLYGRST